MADDLITVASTDTPYEAELIQGALESAGIESFLMDGNTLHVNLLWSFALGGWKIQVRHEDRDAALEILEQLETADSDDISEFGGPLCPACSSGHTALESQIHKASLATRVGSYLFALIVSIAGLLAARRTRLWSYRCLDCGHSWEERSRARNRQEAA